MLSGPLSVTLVTDCAGRPLTIGPAELGVTATDNCDPTPRVTCSPSTISPGTTLVTCTGVDADGNQAVLTVTVALLHGPFTCRLLRPLDGNVDNLIQPGQTIPVRVKVACENASVAGARATIDAVERIDGAGTPIANAAVEDSGLANDGGALMREESGSYVYNLSTKGWTAPSDARFRVVVRIEAPGHVDTLCAVILKAR